MDSNLILVGFMGAGKDSVADEIEKKSELKKLSTDDYIEYGEGLKITEIFKRYGETYFRKLESKALRRIVNLKNIVLATGGGLPVSPENRKLLKKMGKIIYLQAEIETIRKRLKNDNERPLLKEKNLEFLFSQRKGVYDFADYIVNTSKNSPSEIAKKIIKKFKIRGKAEKEKYFETIQVKTLMKEYSIHIGKNILKNLPEYIKKTVNKTNRILVLSDPLISSLYLKDLLSILENDYRTFYLIIKEGEKRKNLGSIKKIYDFMLRERFSREDTIIALGGGVIGDMAGFAASTFKRGMRFVQIPTTLLSQVDSSVGGKTGVNHRDGKNMIGTFYQPDIVLIDTEFLKTLPDKNLKEGISEIIKYGVIKDKKLFELLENKKEKILSLEPEIIGELISRSLKIKAEIVEKDEREEEGIREILNFGHTIGHIVESETGYSKYSHGEAVAIGMAEETKIAMKKKYTTDDTVKRIIDLLKAYKLPVNLPENLKKQNIIEKISQDKKVRNGKLRVPVVREIGKIILEDIKCEEYL